MLKMIKLHSETLSILMNITAKWFMFMSDATIAYILLIEIYIQY